MANSFAKFRGVEKIKEIEKAMNDSLGELLFDTQSKLSKAAPVNTGRLASSFVLGKDLPNREFEPEREAPGEVTVTRQYNKAEIDIKSDWYISNNLKYAYTVANNPIWGKGGRVGGAAWYTTIANNLQKDANASFDRQFRKLK
tara:strand:+ start:5399 stop:5827 length:429 start_codon:yes stop_codon:yes gene_type:complete